MADAPRRKAGSTTTRTARVNLLPSDDIERQLASAGDDPELRSYFGDELYEELKAKLRKPAARGRSRADRGAAPRVLILPGIMGSTLGRDRRFANDAIWLNPAAILQGELSYLSLDQPPGRRDIRAIDVLPLYYTPLRVRLRDVGMNADFFPYDWRLSVEDLAKKLEAQLVKEPAASISLVAHSMGGLVCRAAVKLDGPGIRKVKRIVMLGTPNFGSFVPAQVLSVQYSFVNSVIAMDLTRTNVELTKQVFSTYPSLYQMLPSHDRYEQQDLFSSSQWPASIPKLDRTLLTSARKVQAGLPTNDPRFRMIAGVNQETVTSLQLGTNGEFEFFSTTEGDGTVPVKLARLSDNTPTWYVKESHGGLPRNRNVSEAVIELLQSSDGTTNALSQTWQGTRSLVVRRVAPPAVPFQGRDPRHLTPEDHRQLVASVFGSPVSGISTGTTLASGGSTGGVQPAAATDDDNQMRFSGVVVGRRTRRLEIVLANGSLADVPAGAHVLGMFEGVTPSGAALAVDERSNGLIRDFNSRRMIDGGLGKVSFLPTNCTALPTDLIAFIGLGPFGDFKPERQLVGAAAVVRALVRLRVHDFATVLFGESMSTERAGSSAGPSEALKTLLQGFLTGLRDSDPEHLMQRIVFSVLDKEQYQNLKANFYSLAATKMFDDIELVFAEMEVKSPFPESESADRSAFTSLPSATDSPNYLVVTDEYSMNRDRYGLRFSFLTDTGRGSLPSQIADVEQADLENLLNRFDPDRGLQSPEDLDKLSRELCQLLFPPKFIDRLVESGINDRPLRLVHDASSSKIPWETIQFRGKYPTLHKGLSRHFLDDKAIRKLNQERVLDKSLDVLMVADPNRNLPGAKQEAKTIESLLGKVPNLKLTVRAGQEATRDQLKRDLQSGQYDIVHYAGHAAFDPLNPRQRGLLCADGQFLTGEDLADMSTLPTLVFLNACQSGRIRRAPTGGARREAKATRQDRLKETVSVAEAFLHGGLKLFLGTYWPVDDGAALTFSHMFYQSIVDHLPIGDAVNLARQAVKKVGKVDWADYMLYGDPRFPIKQSSSK